MHRSGWVVVVGFVVGCSSRGTSPQPQPPAARSSVAFPVSCAPEVRGEFERAVTLLHHMTYPQAREAFRAIAAKDPRCAMAHWGVAMTLFQPLWPTRPSPEDLATGWKEVEQARALAPATPRERAYIDAVAAFFDPSATDYWQRIDRWEAAMKAVWTANPGDIEASAFYALSVLASARPGPTMQEHAERAIALLRPIHQRDHEHPGALHYIIHANDVTGREHEDMDVVRHYEHVAPDNPHALHMPTHIYTRLGDWDGVIRGNQRAAEAALRYPAGEYVWDEFPHAIEYLVYAYLQQGADAKAREQIDRLFATPKLEPTAKTAFHLASTRARFALERHAWQEAAAIVPREPPIVAWDKFPWPEAVAVFAHGFGALRGGDRAEPPRALARLRELEQRANAAGEAVFTRQIQMLRLLLEGWSAHASGDAAAAERLLREAVELEGTTPKPPVTPASTLPAPEVLGDFLLERGRTDDALAAYQLSLKRFPRRYNSAVGVARALAAKGDQAGATRAYCELLAFAATGTRLFEDAGAKPYLASCKR